MEVTARNVDRLQHVAVSRLTLFVAGEIHARIEPFQAWLSDQVRQAADDAGLVDTAKLSTLLLVAEPRWRRVMQGYMGLLRAASEQAADIAFTSLRVKNNAVFPEWVEQVQESFAPSSTDWMRLARMWLRRRNLALQVAQQRIYGDGLNLSQRIWRLENGGLQAIRQTLATGMAERTSAWELAQRLEDQLGANRDFPRWTRQRLHALTPRERAEDLSGLLRAGDALQPWQSRGVSYNALRLARNEIQYANHATTSEIAQHFPGIVGRKSRLSPEHPKTDICDEYAAGGPYEPTANFLPLHPQCLCYWEEVLMPPKQFAAQVRGWVAGENDFLDGYSAWLDQRAVGPWAEVAELAVFWNTMRLWMDGDVDAMATVLKV